MAMPVAWGSWLDTHEDMTMCRLAREPEWQGICRPWPRSLALPKIWARWVRSGKPAVQGGAGLAQAGHEVVFGADGVGAGDDARLLAGGADVEADAALALQRQQALVQQPAAQHAGVHLPQLVGRQRRHPRRIGPAGLVQDLQQAGGGGLLGVGPDLGEFLAGGVRAGSGARALGGRRGRSRPAPTPRRAPRWWPAWAIVSRGRFWRRTLADLCLRSNRGTASPAIPASP